MRAKFFILRCILITLLLTPLSPAQVALAANPTADPDIYAVNEDNTLTIVAPGVLDGDLDTDLGDTITAVNNTNPTHGTVTLSTDGSFVYTPSPDFFGTDSFTYQAKDTTEGLSDFATVTINVAGINDPPIPETNLKNTDEDTALTFPASNLSADDSPGPNETGQGLSVTVVTPTINTHGTVELSGGNVTYTPAAHYNGAASFEYTVCDNDLDSLCEVGIVDVTVNAVNDEPTAANDSKSTAEDTPLVFAASELTSNDSPGPNEASQTLTVISVSTPVHGTVGLSSGTITFTPEANYNGTASFQYTVADNGTPNKSATGTVNVTVTTTNDAPTITVINNLTINEDSSTGPLSFTIGDAETPVDSLIVTTNSSDTTLVPLLNIVSGGSGASRTITVTPALNQNGTTTITVNVSDGSVTTPTTFTLDVTAVNDPPIPTGDIKTTNEDINLVFPAADLIVNDLPGPSNENQTLNVTTVNNPTHGTVTLNAGSITYDPDQDYFGAATFEYTVCDNGTPNVCAVGIVTLDIIAVNDAPSFTKGADQTINEDSGTSGLHTITGWATAILKGPANESAQTLTFSLTPTNPALFSVQPAINVTTGALTFTTATNANGSSNITVSLQDSGGVANGGVNISPSVSFLITINPVNDAPTDITLSNDKIAENEPPDTVVGTFSAVDVDAAETFTFALASGGTDNASFEITGNTLKTKATFDVETKASYSIRVKVTDMNGAGVSFEEPFIITVLNVNDAPTTLDDPYTIRQGSTLTVAKTTGMLANDKDVDEPTNQKGYDYLSVGDILTFPQHADLFELTQEEDGEYRGAFVYRPDPHFAGVDTFTYLAVDKEGAFSTETTVEITVLDIESPLVSWTEPVTNGMTYEVITGMLTLAVDAEDNVSISRVRFLRWDAVQNKHVEIATDYEAPYEVVLDTNTLNWGWNQIFAEAYDNLGNRSNIPYIWLYKDKIPTFLPVIAVPARTR